MAAGGCGSVRLVVRDMGRASDADLAAIKAAARPSGKATAS